MPSNKKRRGKDKKKNKTKEEKNNDTNQRRGGPPAGLAFVQAAYQRAEDQHKQQVADKIRKEAIVEYLTNVEKKQHAYDEKILARMESYENLESFFEEEESNIVDLVTTLRITELSAQFNDEKAWWEERMDAIGICLDLKKARDLLRGCHQKVTMDALAEFDRNLILYRSQQPPVPCMHGGLMKWPSEYHPVCLAGTVWVDALMKKSLTDIDVVHEKQAESIADRVPGSKSRTLYGRRDGPGGFLRQKILLSSKIMRQRFSALSTKEDVKLLTSFMSMYVVRVLLGGGGNTDTPFQVLPESSTDKERRLDAERVGLELKVEYMTGLIFCLQALVEVDGDESSKKSRDYEMEKKLRDMHSGSARSWVSFFHKRLPCDYLGPIYRELKSRPKTYQCYCCHKKLLHPRLCTRCKIANYCDSNCQREHWRYHKSFCKHACSLIVDDNDAAAATATAATEALRTDASK